MERKREALEKIGAKFTINTLPNIEGDHNYEVITKMMQLLYYNVDPLLAPQGGGRHGYISIILKSTLYTNLSSTERVNPPNPVVYLKVPTNATASHIDHLQ